MKVGVIGTGSMGRNHVRVYSDIPDVELVAIADPDEKNVKSLAHKYHTKAYTDYKEMLKEDLDAVTSAVPTSFHTKVALDVFKKGIHVLLEKPIAANENEADEIINGAKEHGVVLTIGHIERFNPAVIELKKRMEKGELGKIHRIGIERLGPFPARIRDVGVVIDLAVHDLDILNYITESKIKRLYAETEKKIHTDHEDLLEANMKFKNGTLGMISINWLTPKKIRRVYVTGEKGMYLVDYLKQDLYFYENREATKTYNNPATVIEGMMKKFYINKKEPLRAEIENFIDSITEGKKPLVSPEAGKEALSLAIKLIESGREHKVITL
jgi:predicted dehydrogenase